ncbi:MAG: hypothetical protein IIA85_02510 [Nanoarchaeota archaeon]|nr:hypothetical protein [Nanoarchaeota archaeon]
MKEIGTKKKLVKYIEQISNKEEYEITGSAFKRPFKNFSDIDINVYGKTSKPHYEIICFKNKIILLSFYFYKDKNNIPESMKYSSGEKIKRECQLAVDFMFKYLRTKDKKYLESVQKRIL